MHTIIDSKSLAVLIRNERKAQKLTQEQLAGLTGVGARFVRELEAGKESCQIGRALQVAASLGLTVSVDLGYQYFFHGLGPFCEQAGLPR